MASGDGIALPRLLGQREVQALLTVFGDLDPELGLAVVRPDRHPLATAGSWPLDTLAQTVSAAADLLASPSAGGAEAVHTDAYRCYPLTAGASRVGALVARAGPAGGHACEPLLHNVLTLWLGQRLERREVANEALACYREINLLYRVGETIGRSLDPQAIPGLVLQESQLIKADAGMVLLGDVADQRLIPIRSPLL